MRLMQVLGQVTRPTRQELATIRGTMDTLVPAAHSRYANIRDGGHTNFGRPVCGVVPIPTRTRTDLLMVHCAPCWGERLRLGTIAVFLVGISSIASAQSDEPLPNDVGEQQATPGTPENYPDRGAACM